MDNGHGLAGAPSLTSGGMDAKNKGIANLYAGTGSSH